MWNVLDSVSHVSTATEHKLRKYVLYVVLLLLNLRDTIYFRYKVGVKALTLKFTAGKSFVNLENIMATIFQINMN